jgi:hypothetical protein
MDIIMAMDHVWGLSNSTFGTTMTAVVSEWHFLTMAIIGEWYFPIIAVVGQQ